MEEMIRLNPAAVPAELKALPQWVVWRRERRGGKPTKVPWDAKAPTRKASVTNPATWATFDQALAVKEAAAFDGVGIVFAAGGDLVGVDLDGCRNPTTGALEPWAADIVSRLDTYAEVSVSGRGVHLIARGKLPLGGRRKGSVEMYCDGRYFAVTGAPLDGAPSREIADRQAALTALHAELFGPAPKREAAAPTDAADPRAEAVAVKIGRLVLRPDAEPPSLKLQAALANDPRMFKRSWERRRSDLLDQSASSYDLSLASLCARAGWSDQEVVNTVIAWRRNHGEDVSKVLRVDYMTRTLTTARAGLRAEADVQDAADALAAAAQEPEGVVDDDRRAALLAAASKALGVEIAAFHQLGRDPSTATFAFLLGGGRRVPLGSAADVLTQRRVRAACFAETGRNRQTMKASAWADLCNALGRIRSLVENPAGERGNEMSEWLWQYVYRVHVHDEKSDAVPSNAPFTRAGLLHVHAPSLLRFVKMDLCHMQIGSGDIWSRLDELGFAPAAVTVRAAGRVVGRTYWAGRDRWTMIPGEPPAPEKGSLFESPL